MREDAFDEELRRRCSVPILGQPAIGEWIFTFQLLCPCGHSMMVVWAPGVIRECPKCRAAYRFRLAPTVAPDGTAIQMPIDVRPPVTV